MAVTALSAGAATARSWGPAASATQTSPGLGARTRPIGVVENCSTQQGAGEGSGVFERPRSLVVGPLAVANAGGTLHWSQELRGDKLPVYVRGAHRVTVELSRQTRRGAGLAFGPRPADTLRDTHRIVTFIACRQGEISRPYDGWPVSFWMGFVLASSPRCVPLFIWVDDEISPRRAVVRIGVGSCR